MGRIFTIAEAAKRLKRGVKTLQRWDRGGVLKALRTDTNRRYYTQQMLDGFLGIIPAEESKKAIAYCRVSSQAQKPDLKNQRKILEEFCINAGFYNVEFVEEIGGGLNFRRKKFLKIIEDILSRSVSKLILAHKDRLVRFGFELIEYLCNQYDCELVLLNQERLSPEQEMVQDVMTILHCFSARLYGLRNYKKSLKKVLKEDENNPNT